MPCPLVVKKGSKMCCLGGGTHADAGVGHGEQDVEAGLDFAVAVGNFLGQLNGGALNGEPSAVGHGVTGVDDQIHQDLLELPGIGLDAGRRPRRDG